MQESKQEKSPIKQRILQYLGENGISMYDCYAKTGITRGVLGQNNGLSEDNLARFLAYYTEVSTEWLVLGRGSMLRDSKNPEETKWSSTPIATPISPAEESVIYKMYEKKDGENRVLIEELGGLKERLRSMEQELGALKSKYPHESPPGIVRESGEVLGSSETAKDAHSKRRTPASEPSYKHL